MKDEIDEEMNIQFARTEQRPETCSCMCECKN